MMLVACYNIVGLNPIEDQIKFQKDLVIMTQWEFEISQAVQWNFSEKTYYDMVVDYLSRGILLPDDEISLSWFEFYEKEVKGKDFSETMKNSIQLSFVSVLPQMLGEFSRYKKLKDLEANELNILCIMFEIFCLELCEKLQFEFNFHRYHKNEFATSIIMLMRTFFFNPNDGAGATRVSEMTGQ